MIIAQGCNESISWLITRDGSGGWFSWYCDYLDNDAPFCSYALLTCSVTRPTK